MYYDQRRRSASLGRRGRRPGGGRRRCRQYRRQPPPRWKGGLVRSFWMVPPCVGWLTCARIRWLSQALRLAPTRDALSLATNGMQGVRAARAAVVRCPVAPRRPAAGCPAGWGGAGRTAAAGRHGLRFSGQPPRRRTSEAEERGGCSPAGWVWMLGGGGGGAVDSGAGGVSAARAAVESLTRQIRMAGCGGAGGSGGRVPARSGTG